MIYVIAAIFVVGVVAITLWLLCKSIEDPSLKWISAVVVWFVALIAIGLYTSDKEDMQGPCIEYRTDWYWNAAVKTMMQAKICVARAEWVKP